MFGLSPGELMIVGVVAVLLFGANLPSVARSIGKSYNEFRRGMNDLQDQFRYADAAATRTAMKSSSSSSGMEETAEATRKPSAPKFVPPGAANATEISAEQSASSV